jgi:nitrogen regulatory protein PII
MKLVVGYIDRDTFDPIRTELLGLGFVSISAWEAVGTIPEATIAGSYRGVTIEKHARPKTRLECVAGDNEVSTVVDTIIRHGGERVFAFVLPIEQAYPTTTIKAADEVGAAT